MTRVEFDIEENVLDFAANRLENITSFGVRNGQYQQETPTYMPLRNTSGIGSLVFHR